MSEINPQSANLGEFDCSLDVLAQLIGLPEGARIKHIQMQPYRMTGNPCCRVVVEHADIPPVGQGDAIPQVSPQIRVSEKYPEFCGWFPPPAQQESHDAGPDGEHGA